MKVLILLFLKSPSLAIKELVIRFALSLIRDRVATDMRSLGYSRGDDAMWSIVREDATVVGGSKISASVSEANCIREFVNVSLQTIYKEQFDANSIR